MTPSDGPPHESTDIALVLGPPFDLETEEIRDLLSRGLPEWSRPASSANGARGWLFVSETIIREESEHCVRIYARASR
jgi:hypothetical protein